MVADERSLGSALKATLTPDLAIAPATPNVGFIHRTTPAGELYFIANSSNAKRSLERVFRVSGMEPEFWDPLTAKTSAVASTRRDDKTVTLALEMQPYASRVVVFSKVARRIAPTQALATAAPIDISQGWAVKFASDARQMDRLTSWTDDERTRFYSGTASCENADYRAGGFREQERRCFHRLR
jgi:hypothetical protein